VLELPGTAQVLSGSIARGVLLMTLFGLTIGLLIAFIWWGLSTRPKKTISQEEMD